MTKESFAVTGGKSLQGDLVPQGAKNEALQVLCAVLLSAEPTTISNVPEIRDVAMLLDLLRGLGVEVEKLKSDTYRFTAREIDLDYVQSDRATPGAIWPGIFA